MTSDQVSDGWSDVRPDVRPDGRETLVIGDVAGRAEFSHPQGQNDRGFEGTCGLCSCESVLRQFDVPATENDLVGHATGADLCTATGDALTSGGTSPEVQARILGDYGGRAGEAADVLDELRTMGE